MYSYVGYNTHSSGNQRYIGGAYTSSQASNFSNHSGGPAPWQERFSMTRPVHANAYLQPYGFNPVSNFQQQQQWHYQMLQYAARQPQQPYFQPASSPSPSPHMPSAHKWWAHATEDMTWVVSPVGINLDVDGEKLTAEEHRMLSAVNSASSPSEVGVVGEWQEGFFVSEEHTDETAQTEYYEEGEEGEDTADTPDRSVMASVFRRPEDEHEEEGEGGTDPIPQYLAPQMQRHQPQYQNRKSVPHRNRRDMSSMVQSYTDDLEISSTSFQRESVVGRLDNSRTEFRGRRHSMQRSLVSSTGCPHSLMHSPHDTASDSDDDDDSSYSSYETASDEDEEEEDAVTGPGHSVFGPGHSVFGPGHSVFGPGHSVFGPGHSVFGPGHSVFAPSAVLDLSETPMYGMDGVSVLRSSVAFATPNGQHRRSSVPQLTENSIIQGFNTELSIVNDETPIRDPRPETQPRPSTPEKVAYTNRRDQHQRAVVPRPPTPKELPAGSTERQPSVPAAVPSAAVKDEKETGESTAAAPAGAHQPLQVQPLIPKKSANKVVSSQLPALDRTLLRGAADSASSSSKNAAVATETATSTAVAAPSASSPPTTLAPSPLHNDPVRAPEDEETAASAPASAAVAAATVITKPITESSPDLTSNAAPVTTGVPAAATKKTPTAISLPAVKQPSPPQPSQQQSQAGKAHRQTASSPKMPAIQTAGPRAAPPPQPNTNSNDIKGSSRENISTATAVPVNEPKPDSTKASPASATGGSAGKGKNKRDTSKDASRSLKPTAKKVPTLKDRAVKDGGESPPASVPKATPASNALTPSEPKRIPVAKVVPPVAAKPAAAAKTPGSKPQASSSSPLRQRVAPLPSGGRWSEPTKNGSNNTSSNTSAAQLKQPGLRKHTSGQDGVTASTNMSTNASTPTSAVSSSSRGASVTRKPLTHPPQKGPSSKGTKKPTVTPAPPAAVRKEKLSRPAQAIASAPSVAQAGKPTELPQLGKNRRSPARDSNVTPRARRGSADVERIPGTMVPVPATASLTMKPETAPTESPAVSPSGGGVAADSISNAKPISSADSASTLTVVTSARVKSGATSIDTAHAQCSMALSNPTGVSTKPTVGTPNEPPQYIGEGLSDSAAPEVVREQAKDDWVMDDEAFDFFYY